jgi:hypothetical protein
VPAISYLTVTVPTSPVKSSSSDCNDCVGKINSWTAHFGNTYAKDTCFSLSRFFEVKESEVVQITDHEAPSTHFARPCHTFHFFSY